MAKSSLNRLIVIGGSSGSLEVLLQILPLLPASFPVPILIVMHRNTSADSLLRELLARKSVMPVLEVEEKEVASPGQIYLAPADYHVLVENDFSFSLDFSEKVNYSRPSIDVSMMSAAAAYKIRLTAILLSGANDDGARGMQVVNAEGGYTIVQDPAEALVDLMPRHAIVRSAINAVMKTEAIGRFLLTL